MKTHILPLLFFLALLSFSSCKKHKNEPQLPPATREGKNTFGALVNGEVWLPKGKPNLYQSSLDVVYDPEYQGGDLNIIAYKHETDEYLSLFMTQLDHEGTYSLNNPEMGAAGFASAACDYRNNNSEISRTGKLEITKLDLTNGIIAGTFEFTLAKPGCDTIRVTEGRFDKKLF
ncbi:DUF6252 family protein [Pontibacter mangrovi]|uniref:Lipocalin-like domain-containing protein n=1 Tax=Pontibacter mangrovi TaxID=2589816 RepID=A0A501W5U9_9BACT|nr:DUF6252 family protein [Pontibacter mangrovi]TPE45273.1 hypothetical protein FJM65_04330 [Pontibacter mangrovi]